MNPLPSASFATRVNAFLAAAVVTLTLLSGIDGLARAQGAALPMAQAAATQASEQVAFAAAATPSVAIPTLI